MLTMLVAGALVAERARADAAPLVIDYEAAQGCPDASVFLEEIQGRTSLARVAGPGDKALAVRVRIAARGRGSSGRLDLGEGEDALTREVEGASCEEVVSALALITALAVDPHARTSPNGSASAGVVVEPAPPPVAATAPAAVPAAAPTPPPRRGGGPRPLLITGAPPTSRPRASTSSVRRWAIGARAAAALAVTPRPLLGGGAFVERTFDGAWSTSVRLGAELAATGSFDVGPGGASFGRGVVRLEGCAFAQRMGSLEVMPCLGLEGGGIAAAGVLAGSLIDVRHAIVPWFAAGFVPRAVVDFGAVALEVQGGPVFPAVRRTFTFDAPHYVIYELPAVTWTAALGADIRFP
jgi:hypothetical protein